MRALISTLIILTLVVLFPVSASFARGGHAGHGHGEVSGPRGPGGDVVVIEDEDGSDEDGSDEDDSDEDDLHDENDFDDRDNLNW